MGPVFWLPVVLNKSAPAPVAVFSFAVLASSVAEPIRRVEATGSVAPQ